MPGNDAINPDLPEDVLVDIQEWLQMKEGQEKPFPNDSVILTYEEAVAKFRIEVTGIVRYGRNDRSRKVKLIYTDSKDRGEYLPILYRMEDNHAYINLYDMKKNIDYWVKIA